jgi:hippurate hydrolase
MLDDGLMDRFPARAVYGMHTDPGRPVGSFAIRPGPMFAMADAFEITVVGKGGHAAMPDRAIDPIVAAAALVQTLQTIVARRVDPTLPAVLSVTQFHAGTAHNVIPGSATLAGTVRAFDDGVHRLMRAEMARQCARIGEAFGVAIEIAPGDEPYPPVVNDPAEAAFAADAAESVVGAGAVDRAPPAEMGAEDFSYLSRLRPGAFILIGNGASAPLHHPAFDFDDAAAPYGVAYWTRLVERALPRRA